MRFRACPGQTSSQDKIPAPPPSPTPKGSTPGNSQDVGGRTIASSRQGKHIPQICMGWWAFLALLHPHGNAVQCMRHLKNQRESLAAVPATSPEANKKCQPAEMPLRDVAKALDKIHHSFRKTTALEQAV